MEVLFSGIWLILAGYLGRKLWRKREVWMKKSAWQESSAAVLQRTEEQLDQVFLETVPRLAQQGAQGSWQAGKKAVSWSIPYLWTALRATFKTACKSVGWTLKAVTLPFWGPWRLLGYVSAVSWAFLLGQHPEVPQAPASEVPPG